MGLGFRGRAGGMGPGGEDGWASFSMNFLMSFISIDISANAGRSSGLGSWEEVGEINCCLRRDVHGSCHSKVSYREWLGLDGCIHLINVMLVSCHATNCN